MTRDINALITKTGNLSEYTPFKRKTDIWIVMPQPALIA